MIDGIPLPVTDDPVDAAFWRGTSESSLLVQRCTECDKRRFPPRPMCPACQSSNCAWDAMSGKAKVWSFAAPSSPLLPAFEQLTPYVTALVELDEDPALRIVGPLLLKADGEIQGVQVNDVAIGDRVSAVFKRYADDVNIVCWTLDKSNKYQE